MTRKIMAATPTEETEEFHYDLSVNILDRQELLSQLQKVSGDHWYIGKSHESAKKTVADLKLQIQIRESEIGTELRKSNEKISEARINKSYYDYTNYRELCSSLNEAKQKEGYLAAMLKALEMKHSIMITVASLLKAELRQQI